MKFAINRLDMAGPKAFADSARKAEDLGWNMGLIPCSPLLAQDPYVMLAFAAEATSSIRIGTMLDTPVIRHPAALAGSIATVARLAPGRTLLGLGVGDTAVRLSGLAPARVATLERAIVLTRGLLSGQAMDVGAARPARLRHAADVPVWIAAQGPRTLRMAGAQADGVFVRVGTHPGNIIAAYDEIAAGAREVGRDPANIEIGLIFHTIPCAHEGRARAAAKSVAAGYYEYSRFLFERPGISWDGPDVEVLKESVWPDFHHARDLEAAGALVDFLPAEAADAFALYGSWQSIREQLDRILALDLPISVILPHPIVLPNTGIDYLSDFAKAMM